MPLSLPTMAVTTAHRHAPRSNLDVVRGRFALLLAFTATLATTCASSVPYHVFFAPPVSALHEYQCSSLYSHGPVTDRFPSGTVTRSPSTCSPPQDPGSPSFPIVYNGTQSFFANETTGLFPITFNPLPFTLIVSCTQTRQPTQKRIGSVR